MDRRRSCACTGCPRKTPVGRYCWICWANRRDDVKCVHLDSVRGTPVTAHIDPEDAVYGASPGDRGEDIPEGPHIRAGQ